MLSRGNDVCNEAFSAIGGVAKQTEVSSEIDRLSSAIEANSLLVDELTERLRAVTSESNQKDGASGNQPESIIVPLAQNIRNHRYTIEESNNRLRNLIGKLEL